MAETVTLVLVLRPASDFSTAVQPSQRWTREVQVQGIPVKGDVIRSVFTLDDHRHKNMQVSHRVWWMDGRVEVYLESILVFDEKVRAEAYHGTSGIWVNETWGDIERLLSEAGWEEEPE